MLGMTTMVDYFWNFLSLTLSGAVLGIFGWAFQLQSKLNIVNGRADLLDQKYLDLKELINSRFDEMGRRLTRIEHSMNGKLRD